MADNRRAAHILPKAWPPDSPKRSALRSPRFQKGRQGAWKSEGRQGECRGGGHICGPGPGQKILQAPPAKSPHSASHRYAGVPWFSTLQVEKSCMPDRRLWACVASVRVQTPLFRGRYGAQSARKPQMLATGKQPRQKEKGGTRRARTAAAGAPHGPGPPCFARALPVEHGPAVPERAGAGRKTALRNRLLQPKQRKRRKRFKHWLGKRKPYLEVA